MTTAEDAAPALLAHQPTWLISQVSAHARRLTSPAAALAQLVPTGHGREVAADQLR